MNDKMKSLRENVLAKIKEERVSMHSYAYFVIKMIALMVVALAVLMISVFLFNFILFAIHESGSDELLGFGDRGFWIFLKVFPWWLLALDIVLIACLEYLLRQFRFGYKSPVLYLLFGLVVVTVSAGLTVERATVFNDFLRDRAHEHRLPPPLNGFYDRSDRLLGSPDDGMCRCTITSIQGDTIYADDVDVGTTTHMIIKIPQDTANATTSGLTVGDVIFVAGDRDGDTIEAFGIRKLPPGSPSVMPGPHREGGRDDYDDQMPAGAPAQSAPRQ